MKKTLVILLLLYCPPLFCETLDEAELAMRNGDYAVAYCLLKPLAEDGNAEAQYNVGWMYHNGYGLRVNDNLALEWWLSASEQGYTDASFSIGMLYNLGEGQISKNLSKAVDYYILAATDKHDEAIIILRSMLMRDDKAVRGRKREIINRFGELLGPQLQVKANKLNVRQMPSLEGKVITQLKKNDQLIELHKQGRWSQIGIINSPSEQYAVAWAYNPLLEPLDIPEPKAENKKQITSESVINSPEQLPEPEPAPEEHSPTEGNDD